MKKKEYFIVSVFLMCEKSCACIGHIQFFATDDTKVGGLKGGALFHFPIVFIVRQWGHTVSLCPKKGKYLNNCKQETQAVRWNLISLFERNNEKALFLRGNYFQNSAYQGQAHEYYTSFMVELAHTNPLGLPRSPGYSHLVPRNS